MSANTIFLRALAWDHVRATGPLRASAEAYRRIVPSVSVHWEVQPLSGFEFTPMAELARHHDLLVFDHPHVGEALAEGALRSLHDPWPSGDPGPFIGPSLQSYRYRGHLLGLPIDAACQVAAYRPDLLHRVDAPVPSAWTGVLALGEKASEKGLELAIALAGVHSLMTLYSLCASLGRPMATEPGEPLYEHATLSNALDALGELVSYCPAEAFDWNSIAVQDALRDRDDLVYCPAVYGFSPYAEAGPRRLAYAGFPGLAGTAAGSTIGGAGIGVSAHAREPQAAIEYARWLAGTTSQVGIFPQHHGQPAHAAAWHDEAIDRAYGGFYSATRNTLEQAWTRPRFAGYLGFQRDAGLLVEAHLRGRSARRRLLDDMQAAWEAACA